VYTAVLYLLFLSFIWGRWIRVGCYNGSWYKKVENHWSAWCGCRLYYWKCFKNKAKDLV